MEFLGRKEHVVVLGAGYGGLSCALELSRKSLLAKNERCLRVTLINTEGRQELSCELFRSLRTGQGEYFDFKHLLRKHDIRFVEGRVCDIDPFNKEIALKGASVPKISYDSLVIATGYKTMLPQLEGFEERLRQDEFSGEKKIFFFKNNAHVQALRLGLRRLGWQPTAFAPDKSDLFVVVLGGGSTGLEVAGEIAAMRGQNRKARVIVVDSKATLLPSFSPIAQKILKKELARMHIETVLGSPAKKILDRELHIENGQVIPWDLLIVCTGGGPSPTLFSKFGSSFEASRGLLTQGNCEVLAYPSHFAIGDIGRVPQGRDPLINQIVVPKRAQFAQQEAHFLAKHLVNRQLQSTFHQKEASFEITDLGYMVSLGPYNGIGRVGPEFHSRFSKLLSPFVVGPLVDEIKRATKLKYLASLKWGLKPQVPTQILALTKF